MVSNTFHPYSGSVVFSAELGGSYPSTDFIFPELDILGRGMVEYYFPSKSIHAFGLRVLGGGGYITSEGGESVHDYYEKNFRTNLIFIGTGANYAVKLGSGIPYLSAMISYLRFDPRDKEGQFLINNFNRVYELNALIYTGEIGVRFPIMDDWSLNIGANINFTNTDYLDDVKIGDENDYYMSAFCGISYYLGGQKDSDNDGIEDGEDFCPSTPKGVNVDSFGCPTDSDNDGVPDYLDNCSNTPRNILIDEHGCPLDKDSDSIPDYLDRCNDTPPNVLVDQSGCPLDSDHDGVPNYLDNCPDTPRYTKVDSTGCPIGMDTTTTSNKAGIEFQDRKYNNQNDKLLEDMYFTDGRLYGFQIHALKSSQKAKKVEQGLREKGLKAFIEDFIPTGSNVVWYRVRIGYFDSLAAAKNYKRKYFNK